MTLFPDLVNTVLGESIIGRAQKSGAVEINTYNIRDYSEDKHRRVDDTPYGGGKGMLMMAPPIYNCYSAILKEQKNAGFEAERRRIIYMSPAGKVLNQKKAEELFTKAHKIEPTQRIYADNLEFYHPKSFMTSFMGRQQTAPMFHDIP